MMYRYFTIFIFLCALLTVAESQSTALADSLFAAGDYELAAVEYERCAYKAETRQTSIDALRCKAECFKRQARYGLAGDALQRCLTDYADYQQLALCRYLDGDFEDASFAVDRCEIVYDTLSEDMLLIKMMALNELALYDSARVVACHLAIQHRAVAGVDIAPLVDSLYSSLPRLKNERLAWYLSLVPGLGHLYAGEYGLGAVAFAMNAALLAFGVWQVLEGCYITAYMGGAGLLSVTYPGSMRNAEYCVRRYNYKNTTAFNRGVKDAVMDALVVH